MLLLHTDKESEGRLQNETKQTRGRERGRGGGRIMIIFDNGC